jgi:hypothetical protein
MSTEGGIVEAKVFNPSDLLARIGEIAGDYLREGYSNPEILARLRDLLLDAYEQKWITEKPSRLTAYRWGGTLYINHCGEVLGHWVRRVWTTGAENDN